MLKKKKGKMLHFILLKNFNEYWKLLLKTAKNAGNYCWKMLNGLLKKITETAEKMLKLL